MLPGRLFAIVYEFIEEGDALLTTDRYRTQLITHRRGVFQLLR